MDTAFTILCLLSPVFAVAVGYLYGPKTWEFCFRFAGRQARLRLSGYALAIVILAGGMLFGALFSPTISTACHLRRVQPLEDASQ
jgi:hypothetical protein